MGDYYRGGNSVCPRRNEVRFNRATGLLKTERGASVYDRPDNLERFGGAHRVTNVPESLRIVQRGQDPNHFEIVPANPMTFTEYEVELAKIVLVPV
jgi:hypothetical protein